MGVFAGMDEYLSALGRLGLRARIYIRSTMGKASARANRLPGFFALCDQGVVSITNFATGVVIGRICGRPELGVYALAWTVMTLTLESSATLTTTPYAVFGPQLNQDQRKLYLGSILVHQFLFSIAFAVIMIAATLLGFWHGWLSNSLSSVIATSACVGVFMGLREFGRRVSFAELKVGTALLIDFVACVGQAAGVLLLLHFGALTASRAYTLLGISSALVAAGWLVLHRAAFRFDAGVCTRDIKRNWRFAQWVLGSWMLSALAMYLYPWLLAAMYGTSATGIWAACTAVVALGNPILLGLGNYAGPQIHNVFAMSGAMEMNRRVYRSSLLFTTAVLPIVLVLAVGGNRIVTGIYGKAYTGSGGIVILLALNLLISSAMYPFSRGLFSLDCAKIDMFINVVAVSILFTVGIAAVKSHGAPGAAAILLASSAVTAVVRVGVFAREIRRRAPAPVRNARQLAIESSES